MVRRKNELLTGTRFLGDFNKKIFHDLDNETPYCYIEEIIDLGVFVEFETLSEAVHSGFHFCKWCVGGAYEIKRIEDKHGEHKDSF